MKIDLRLRFGPMLLIALLGCCQVALAVPGDFDNDSIMDENDADADNDGIPNINEGAGDSDFDGLPDFLDLDSDNDTIPDIFEVLKDRGVLFALDADLNGQIDPGVELGANGLANALEVVPDAQNINFTIVDSDNDRVPDHLDLDSDNDGLSDRIEYRNILELQLAQVVGINDPDQDGLDNSFPLLREFFDTDGDGIENVLDTDSDQDGLSDLLESADITFDRDNNGRIDQFLDTDGNGLQDSLQGSPLQFGDADNDGIPNHQDLDSNNNGIFDSQEAGLPNVSGVFVSNQPPVVQMPVVEMPVVEQPPVEEPVVEAPVEEPVVEAPVEEPVVDEPVAETPVVETPAEPPTATVAPPTNPTATTGSNTIVDAENETTTNTVTNSSFDPIENPIRPSNTTVTTGRDGSVLGAAGIEWLLLLGMVTAFKLCRRFSGTLFRQKVPAIQLAA